MLDAATITVNFHSFNNVYKSIIYVCQTFLLITAVLSKVCPAGSKKDILYSGATSPSSLSCSNLGMYQIFISFSSFHLIMYHTTLQVRY